MGELQRVTTVHEDDGFRWRTMDGEVLSIAEMQTSHIFNSMKMCFNHLAETWGGRPVWFNHKYTDYFLRSRLTPEHVAALVIRFITEIERRGDLPQRYTEPYWAIIYQILGFPQITRTQKLLMPARSDARHALKSIASGPTTGAIRQAFTPPEDEDDWEDDEDDEDY